MNKRRLIILVMAIVCFGMLIVGGTYAFLSFSEVTIEGNVSGLSACFIAEEDYSNGDGTTAISGTLFQSSKPRAGLSGKVGLKISSSCRIGGVGHIYLTVNSATASVLYQKAKARCENPTTLETMTSYTTSSTCKSAGGT